MERFVRFCRGLPHGVALEDAIAGYERSLHGAEPPVTGWKLEQVQEALRLFAKGTVDWRIEDNPGKGVDVKFRTRVHDEEEKQKEGAATGTQSEFDDPSPAFVTPSSRGAQERSGPGALAHQPCDPLSAADQECGAHWEANSWQQWREAFEKKMAVRRYALRTRDTYRQWARRYLTWTCAEGTDPAVAESISEHLSDLALRGRVAANTQNQALNALIFLVREVMGREIKGIDAFRARQGRHLPAVLSQQEVTALLQATIGVPGLALKLLYGTGMRRMELLRLRVKDVDFDRNIVTVKGGKGDKDRPVMSRIARARQLGDNPNLYSFGTGRRRWNEEPPGCVVNRLWTQCPIGQISFLFGRSQAGLLIHSFGHGQSPQRCPAFTLNGDDRKLPV